MGMYSSITTSNPSGTEGVPNVSQYGWTSYEVENYKQLVEYVDDAKKYADEVKQNLQYILLIKGEIDRIKGEIDLIYIEAKDYIDQIKGLHAQIREWYYQINLWLDQIASYRDEILQMKLDVERMHAEVTVMKEDVKLLKDAAAISEANAAQSAEDSKKSAQDSAIYFELSYALYLDLKKGLVHRGVWNPSTQKYPDPKRTNSVWDVILDKGLDSYDWGGTTWFWGDRLSYVLEDDKFYQLDGSTGVKSVNGKTGAITLNHVDVGALPSTGEANLDGKLTVTNTNDVITIVNKDDTAPAYLQGLTSGKSKKWSVGKLWISEDIAFSADKYGTSLTLKENSVQVNKEFRIQDGIAYHTNFRPTPGDIGAYTKVEVDNLVAGRSYTKAEVDAKLLLKADVTYVNQKLDTKVDKTTLINGKPLTSDVTLTPQDIKAVSKEGDSMSGPLDITSNGNQLSMKAFSNAPNTFTLSALEDSFTLKCNTTDLITSTKDGNVTFKQDSDTLGLLKEKGVRVYSPANKPTPGDLNAADMTSDDTKISLLTTSNSGRTKEVRIYSKDNRLYSVGSDGTVAQFYNDRTFRPSLADVGGLGVENGNELNFPSTTPDFHFGYRKVGNTTAIDKYFFHNGKSQLAGYADVVGKEFYAQGDKRVFHEGYLPSLDQLDLYSKTEINEIVVELNKNVEAEVAKVDQLAFVYALIL